MKTNKKKLSYFIVLPWIAAILIIVLLFVLLSGGAAKSNKNKTAEGLSYLSAQAEEDPQKVDLVLREREQNKQQETTEAQQKKSTEKTSSTQASESDLDSVWGEFRDFTVLGDSRAVGFYYFKFLDKSRVLAGGGKTIRDIPEYLNDIKLLNPSYVYLCFGLNDTGIGYWQTAEEYAKEMNERIDQIQQAAPGCKVIISSILPVKDFKLEKNPSWRKMPDFSKAVEELCKTKDNVVFVNNDELAKQYMEKYWDEDGVHLKPEFYPYWAKNLLNAAYGS